MIEGRSCWASRPAALRLPPESLRPMTLNRSSKFTFVIRRADARGVRKEQEHLILMLLQELGQTFVAGMTLHRRDQFPQRGLQFALQRQQSAWGDPRQSNAQLQHSTQHSFWKSF